MKEVTIPMFMTLDDNQYDRIMLVLQQTLPGMTDVDISVITMLAAHGITINKTIASNLVMGLSDYIKIQYPQYGYEQHQLIEVAVNRVVEIIYNLFTSTMSQFMLPLPAKVGGVTLTQYTLQVSMICVVEEQVWQYQYTTSDQFQE